MLPAPPIRWPGLARRASRVSVCLAALLWGGACKAPSASSPPPAPVRVVIGLHQTTTYPSSAPLGMNVIISALMNERLVVIDRNGRPEPTLAERWDRSKDGLTWRVHLRPNLRFHDGSPLDAFQLSASLTAQPGGDLASIGLPPGTTVSAENATTMVFKLREPSSLFIEYLAAVSVASGGKQRSTAGPYDLVSRDADRARLKAFSGYYRGKPQVDSVEVVVYPNARNAWSAMMRDEVDFLYDVTPEAVDFIEQSSLAEVKTFLRPYVYTMAMNQRHPALRHREVRVALNEAVNRTRIIDRVFRGRGYPATSHVWPKHWAYDHRLPRFRFVPSDAVRRLDAAGFPLKSTGSGPRKARFSFTCLVPDADIRYERIALLLQQQLIDVGIDMQLQSISVREASLRMSKGDYDAVLLDMISTGGLSFIDRIWHSTGGRPAYLLDSGYAAADPALNRLRLAESDEEMRQAVHDLQVVLHEDPPAIFICWAETSRAISGRFRLPHVTDRDILRTIPQWQLASRPRGGTP